MNEEIQAVAQTVEQAVVETDRVIEPVRQSVFKRFPIVFTLLVAFGVAATFFGIERIMGSVPWFNDHPWRIFLSGIFALVLTGKLYQKLG